MNRETNELVITRENYKHKLLELDELRQKHYELTNNKDVNDTESIVKLFGMLDECNERYVSYDGHQSEIDRLSEKIDRYNQAFESYISVIQSESIRWEKEKADIQDTIRKYESNIKSIDDKLRVNKNIESEIQKGLLKKPNKSLGNQYASINIQKGSILEFGYYRQDSDTKWEDPIEWIVLKIKDGKALLISKYELDNKQYNEELVNVTWENCSLRKWLNGEFINKAFSIDKQELIQCVKVAADKNPTYNTDPGNDTNDRIFLLSINDANEYFASYEDIKCQPTDYAIAKGAFRWWEDFSGNWWLRSPGVNSNVATYVHCGLIGDDGVNCNSRYGVRPALWIDLEPFQSMDNRSEIKKGRSIKFGTYLQDYSSKRTSIEWGVLDTKEGKALLISKYALECKPYNEIEEGVTWENCSLRNWLNDDFINNAFSTDEQDIIQRTNVTADWNPEFNTDPGNDTYDKVFLFSINEANEYFAAYKGGECKLTNYASLQGDSKKSSDGKCWWWLRSPGSDSDSAAYVYGEGVVYSGGSSVSNNGVGVRPAMWIDIESYADSIER